MTAVNTAPAFSGVETATLPIVKVQRRGGNRGGARWYRGGRGGGARAYRGGQGARAWRGGGGRRYANQRWRGNRSAYRGKRYANRGWRGGRYAYRSGGWGYPYYYNNGYYNGALAAGIFGLATGAIIGSALSQPYYYDAPVSYAYAPWTPEWYSYCAAKYRSFNPDTGYYLAYSGRYRFCR
ncbi:BA14K family protein [Stappia sp. F7233]|uniref:Lectin-like protein BA14k n=2 Tax=Stappia albiluteola TaxID=2758565 RepID=A0A839AFD5_9HYPH|nr:BA14K family protein [Stappia albiluteola]